MKRKDEITAAELMARLLQDPTYLREEAKRSAAEEKQRSALLSALKPVVDDLRTVGITVDSIDDLAVRHAPLRNEAVNVLLKWLFGVQQVRAREQIVRALGAAANSFPGQALAETFDQTNDESLMWAISSTIASAQPTGIADWLRERVLDSRIGKPREMLVVAIARLLPSHEAKHLLRKLLNEFPGHAALALSEIGGLEDISLLEEGKTGASDWQRVEIEKAIRRIQQRFSD